MTAREIAALFEDLELRLISSLKRNLARHKAEEKGEGFDWPAWQAEKLRSLQRFRRENKSIMAEYSDQIDAETRALMRRQFSEADGSAGAFFGVNARKLDALIDGITHSEARVERAALRYMDDVYRKTILRAAAALDAGGMTVQQATDLATKDFLAQGINCVRYKNGRMVNIASYAEMALRTNSTRAMLLGEAQLRERMNIDTVLVSQYGGCSETCLPWQGLVYIDDVWQPYHGGGRNFGGTYGYSRNGRSYPLLNVAVRAGLFHPNCRHHLTTWVEGVSVRPEPMDRAAVERTARLEARQRELECRVRKYKRLAEGTLEPEKAAGYRRAVRAAQKDVREFVDEHGDVLRRDYWRERYDGTGSFTSASKNGIINSRGDGVGIDIEIDRFTPCLLDTETNELVETEYKLATAAELKGLKAKGWLFNWRGKDLSDSEIYKLTIQGDDEIQGLVAIEPREDNLAYHLSLAESAPKNRIGRRYEGVGGHLFAIAAQKSMEAGYGGFIFFEAKNTQLVNHYQTRFGATWVGRPHDYSMIIDEMAAQELLDSYTLNGGD